jgi:branched-chain amino acid aminotransferase
MRPEIYCDSNGSISKEAPRVSLLDHGFLFGDSLYEVVRLYDKKILGWKEHAERLIDGGSRTGINVKDLLPEIENRAHALFKEMKHANAAVRIIVTRGVGELHINPEYCKEPSVYLAAWQIAPELTPKSMTVAVTKTRRNSIRSLDPAIKSGNYLNNVLAFREAQSLGYDDAILLNPDDQVSELSTSNIGWIRDGQVKSPDVGVGILHGITRRLFLEKVEAELALYPESELKGADEVFALSTFKEVLPVSEVRFEDGSIKKYPIDGRVLELRKKFKEMIAEKLKDEDPIF